MPVRVGWIYFTRSGICRCRHARNPKPSRPAARTDKLVGSGTGGKVVISVQVPGFPLTLPMAKGPTVIPKSDGSASGRLEVAISFPVPIIIRLKLTCQFIMPPAASVLKTKAVKNLCKGSSVDWLNVWTPSLIANASGFTLARFNREPRGFAKSIVAVTRSVVVYGGVTTVKSLPV